MPACRRPRPSPVLLALCAVLTPGPGVAVATPRAPLAVVTASSSAPRSSLFLSVDGRKDAAWSARRVGACRWRAELTATTPLGEIEVLLPGPAARAVVATSVDGRSFVTAATVTLPGHAWRRVLLGGRAARFVRLVAVSADARPARVAEVRLHVAVGPVALPAARR
jgi:hypothetical protein